MFNSRLVCQIMRMLTPVEDPRIPLLAAKEELKFHDVRDMELPKNMTALQAWDEGMQVPIPFLATAFMIRDKIASWFGVKHIGGFSAERPQREIPVQKGDHLDFFLVEDIQPQLLVMTDRDTHLDVMTCISTFDQRLTITSSVVVHNWFGHAYMLVVGPAHKLIVNAMIRGLKRRLRV